MNMLNTQMLVELIWILGSLCLFIALKNLKTPWKGLELESLEKSDRNFKDYKKNYNKMINYLDSNNIVENELLLERLDEKQLTDASLIDYTQFTRRMKRINTKIK